VRFFLFYGGVIFMNIMCPQKLKGPTKFLRHTLDLGTKHSSPFLAPRLSDWIRTVDTRYPGSSQRYFQLTPPPAPPPNVHKHVSFGSLEQQVTRLHFLADRIPVLYLRKSPYQHSNPAPPHTAICRAAWIWTLDPTQDPIST